MNRVLAATYILLNCLLMHSALASNDAGSAATSNKSPDQSRVESNSPPLEVVVSAQKDPEWKTYRAFTAGMDIFEAQHIKSPNAPLRFVLLPKAANATLKGINLRIIGDETTIPLPITEDGTFTVPRSDAATKENADLMLNRKPGTFRWRPDIRTPGVPENARRLGDLRLECAVRWAIEEYETPYLIRKLFYAAGQPCLTSHIKVDYISSRPIKATYLTTKDRRSQLSANLLEDDGYVYVVPVDDESWPDDALLEFEYAWRETTAIK